MHPQSRALIFWGGAAALTATLIGGGIAVIHRTEEARYRGAVTPVAVTIGQCMSELTHPPYGVRSAAARPRCAQARRATWFRATVKNVGLRPDFLKGCWVTGVQSSGRTVWRLYLSVGSLDPPAGPRLDPGTSLTWSWYLTDSRGDIREAPARASRYLAQCPVIDYHGNVPV